MAPPSEEWSHQPKNKRRRGNNNNGKGGGRGGGGPRRPHHNHNHHGNAAAPSSLPTKKHSHHQFPLETRVVHAKKLGPSLPPLIITYTNEQDAVAKWLSQHVLCEPLMCVVGLDTETKPCFTREAALASKGPDTLQLAVADGNCLVVHLSRMEKLQDLNQILLSGISREDSCDSLNVTELLQLQQEPEEPTSLENSVSASDSSYSRLEGYVHLSKILKSGEIAKVGVSIDDDALELLKNHSLETNCRLDLRNIDKDEEEQVTGKVDVGAKAPAVAGNNNSNSTESNSNDNDTQQSKTPKSLKGLAEFYVQGMVLPKIKKLQMSNWAGHLSDAQIGYAAADAFAGAIVVATLDGSSEHNHTKNSLVYNVMEDEVDIVNLREARERRKQERKRKREQEKMRNEKKKHKGKQQGGKNNRNKRNNSMKKLYPIHSHEVSNNKNNNSKSAINKNDNKNRKKRSAPAKDHRAAESNPVYAQLQGSLSSPR